MKRQPWAAAAGSADLLLTSRKVSWPLQEAFHREGSQGGEYGASTRCLERRARPSKTSRTSAFLFSSRQMLLWRSHVVSSQRIYFCLSSIDSPAGRRASSYNA